MKKILLFLMVLAAFENIAALQVGVGLNFDLSFIGGYVEDETDHRYYSLFDSNVFGGTVYLFTERGLEISAGAGLGIYEEDDDYDLDENSIKDFAFNFYEANIGIKYHFIVTEYVDVGMGVTAFFTFYEVPTGTNVPAFDQYEEIAFGGELPLFLDVKLSNHIVTRLSMNIMLLTYYGGIYETSGSNTIIQYSDVRINTELLQSEANLSLIIKF